MSRLRRQLTELFPVGLDVGSVNVTPISFRTPLLLKAGEQFCCAGEACARFLCVTSLLGR